MLANILTFLTFAGLALSAALPSTNEMTTAAITNNLVTLHLFSSNDCTGTFRELALDNHVCAALGEDANSLRVVEHVEELRYNSLHVHSAFECNSGPVLQPLNQACSAVMAYKSVRVDFDEEEG